MSTSSGVVGGHITTVVMDDLVVIYSDDTIPIAFCCFDSKMMSNNVRVGAVRVRGSDDRCCGIFFLKHVLNTFNFMLLVSIKGQLKPKFNYQYILHYFTTTVLVTSSSQGAGNSQFIAARTMKGSVDCLVPYWI